MSESKENIPFVIEFKNNYGAATNNSDPSGTEVGLNYSGHNNVDNSNSSGIQPASPSMLYCLHGQDHVELRGHCHKGRIEGVDIKARKKLIIASVLCLVFMIVEIVGGVLSNSLAIATDAAHLLTDFASFMISLFAIWIAGRPATQRMSFGWYRAEVIGALVSVIMIWVITAILVWLAIQRVITKEYEVDSTIMLITSALAIVVNLIMGFQLHPGHSHSHSHGKATESTVSTNVGANPTIAKKQQNNYHDSSSVNNINLNGGTGTKPGGHSHSLGGGGHSHSHSHSGENMNVRAAFIHVLGDVLQSVGVFVAALLIYFRPDWAIADPICTFVFSIIVLMTTIAIIKDALLVLMEGTPSYLQYTEVLSIFERIDGVKRVHNLRMWALSINKVALSVHLAIESDANPKKILQEATTAVHLKYNFFETTIQIEDFTPEMENCQQCTMPEN